MALLYDIVDFLMHSYLSERRRLLENAFVFPSCDVNSEKFIYSPAGKRARRDLASESRRTRRIVGSPVERVRL